MSTIHPGPMQERWNRIFGESGKSLIVALDHIPSGLMKGWEHPADTLKKIVDGNPNGVMVNFGILKQYSQLFSNGIATILRMDGGPSYLLEEWPDYSNWGAFYSVQDAIRLGADGVIVNVFIGGRSEVDSLKTAAKIAADCLQYGVPCAFEPLPVGSMIRNEYDPQMIAFAARMAAEFGADFIKTYYTGDRETFRFVTSRCPVPVLIAGGPKTHSERQLFETIKGMLDGGGCGAFVGRNIWQHHDPTGMLRALRLLIHEAISVDDAIMELSGTSRDIATE